MGRVLAVAALVMAGSFAGAAAAPNIATLSALQLVVGFATAASFGPLIADVSQWFLRRRGIAVAIIASGNYLSGAIWPLVLADILAGPGWRPAYLVIAASALLIMLPLSYALRRPLPDEAMQASAAAAALRAKTAGIPQNTLLWLLALAGIGCCVAMAMPQVHIVAYCVDLGYGPAVGAEMLSLMLMGGVASRLVSGVLADKLGGVLTLLIGSSLQMIALFLYLPASGLVSLYVVSLIFGLSQGGIVPSYAIIVREYLPPKEAGAKVGFVIMATIVGMALGGWMSGWIYDLTGSYRLAFINGIAFNAPERGRDAPDPLPLAPPRAATGHRGLISFIFPKIRNRHRSPMRRRLCRKAGQSRPRPPSRSASRAMSMSTRAPSRANLGILPGDHVRQIVHHAQQMRQCFFQLRLIGHATASLPLRPPSDRRAASLNSRRLGTHGQAEETASPQGGDAERLPRLFRRRSDRAPTACSRRSPRSTIATASTRWKPPPWKPSRRWASSCPTWTGPMTGSFAFQEDGGAEDGTWLALRYDMTAPLARVAAQFRNDLPNPYRRYTMGPVWRNEKPGPGRFRQFYQCDADTVGAASVAADAEICAMLADTLEAVGDRAWRLHRAGE